MHTNTHSDCIESNIHSHQTMWLCLHIRIQNHTRVDTYTKERIHVWCMRIYTYLTALRTSHQARWFSSPPTTKHRDLHLSIAWHLLPFASQDSGDCWVLFQTDYHRNHRHCHPHRSRQPWSRCWRWARVCVHWGLRRWSLRGEERRQHASYETRYHGSLTKEWSWLEVQNTVLTHTLEITKARTNSDFPPHRVRNICAVVLLVYLKDLAFIVIERISSAPRLSIMLICSGSSSASAVSLRLKKWMRLNLRQKSWRCVDVECEKRVHAYM